MGRRGYYPPLTPQSVDMLHVKKCEKCNKVFQVGDLTYVKVTRRSIVKTKRYHKECWDTIGY